MKLKLNIPTTLDNVTLRAYKKYHKLQNEIEDIKLLKVKVFTIHFDLLGFIIGLLFSLLPTTF